MKLYELKNILHRYDKKVVLDFSYLCFSSREMIGISGKNGSGKSTLLRLLAFLESPSEGEVIYYREGRKEIAILLPDVILLSRSVRANLEYMFRIRKRKVLESKIKEVLALVGLEPNLFLNRSYLELSSGERQRVGLAQRLLLEPKVLLLDEPTNSLDYGGLEAFSRAIWWANEEFGSTVIAISHDKKWLDQNSKRRLKLHFGQLIEQNQANLLSHNWSKKENGEKYYDFGGGNILILPHSAKLDMREGIFIDQDHIVINPQEGGFEARVEGIRFSPQERDKIILECKIGNEIVKKILPLEMAEGFKILSEIRVGFDIKGIVNSNIVDSKIV